MLPPLIYLVLSKHLACLTLKVQLALLAVAVPPRPEAGLVGAGVVVEPGQLLALLRRLLAAGRQLLGGGRRRQQQLLRLPPARLRVRRLEEPPGRLPEAQEPRLLRPPADLGHHLKKISSYFEIRSETLKFWVLKDLWGHRSKSTYILK